MLEIQRADPRTRKRMLLGVAAIMTACVAGYMGLQRWLAGLRGLDPAHIQRALEHALIWASWAATVPSAVLAACMWHYGMRVCRSDRFPAPGSKVIRDTEVLHGRSAQLRGMVLKVLASFLALLSAGTLIASYRLLARLHA